MISQVDICNLALTHLGQKTISSIDEGTENARRLKLIFDIERDTVLASSEWNFATKIEILSQLSSETIAGWTYLYSEPSKCLFIRRVFNDESKNDTLTNKQTEFRKVISPTTNIAAIACDLDQASIEYTRQITDVSLFSIPFIEALSYKLAAVLAHPLTGNLDLGKTMMQMFIAIVGSARVSNFSERKKLYELNSTIITERG